MSFTARLIKTAINLTPDWVVRGVANFVLKEIAELKFFHFDLDARKLYVEVQLVGESETIQVWMEEFYVKTEQNTCTVALGQTRSNRIWLSNLLLRLAGRTWTLPVPPQFAAYAGLLSELFQPKSSAV